MAVQFSLTEALQLTALIPSLLLAAYLLATGYKNRQIWIPLAYFLTLAAGFAEGLIDSPRRGIWQASEFLRFLTTLSPVLAFLFILQCLRGANPPRHYGWLLLIPVTGGILLAAARLQPSDACFASFGCLPPTEWQSLYHIFTTTFLFLWLLRIFSREGGKPEGTDHASQKYWLIVTLVSLNLLLLVLELLRLGDSITYREYELSATLLRLSFVYLVTSTLYRVHSPAFAALPAPAMLAPSLLAPPKDTSAIDAALAEKVRILLEEKKLYREMKLNREMLARQCGVNEQVLSRAVNQRYGASVTEVINRYRLTEARQRLRDDPLDSITTIAFDVGFNSIATFNRVFRQQVGCTPREYRSGKDSPDSSNAA
jgi:AraC-like DNA-binding protein